MTFIYNTDYQKYTTPHGALIIAFLQHLKEKNTFGCCCTQKEMGEQLGLSPATVSKLTKELVRQNIIQFELPYRRWDVLDREGWIPRSEFDFNSAA